LIFDDDILNLGNLTSRKATATLQAHWIKPKLSKIVIAFNMNMGGLVSVTRKKEETISSNTQNSWHF
jgi:hypothetical protein